MDHKSSFAVILLLLFSIGIALLLLERVFTRKHGLSEPPLCPQRIPFIGHMLGLFTHGTPYFKIISLRTNSPIYTLNVLSKKLYVVSGPEFVSAVSRNSRTLNFNPFIAEIGARLIGLDAAGRAIIKDNVDGKRGYWGYLIEVHDRAVAAMQPGLALDKAIQTMLEQSAAFISGAGGELREHPIYLQRWLRHIIVSCSATALYGEDNPLKSQPELEDAFSNFQSDINMLAVDVYPKLFARKGHRARVRLAGAFARYFSRFRLGHSSAFIEGHYETAAKFGMTPQHMGQIEVGTLIGILVNTIPTLFYMLHSICADETLLRDVRAEVEACITIGSEIDLRSTGKRLSMDSTKIREACPLLVSVFQEVLRFYSRGATARLVLEDTMLNEQYLLKKDAVIIMPTSVIHSNSSVWGSAEFNPRRFVKTKDGPRRNAPAAAYRPFGGGYAMCPGRHFAAVEILALTAMLVHQYDIKPVSGEWKLPTAVQPSLAVNVFPPKEDVRVWMVPREGLEDVEWVFGVV